MQTPPHVLRNLLCQPPGHGDRLLPLPAGKDGLAAVEERCCLAVAKFGRAHEEVHPRPGLGSGEDATNQAVAAGLRLALPLHAVGADKMTLVVVAGRQAALLQGGQQDQILVQPDDARVPVARLNTAPNRGGMSPRMYSIQSFGPAPV